MGHWLFGTGEFPPLWSYYENIMLYTLEEPIDLETRETVLLYVIHYLYLK